MKIGKTVQDAINEQITNELYSAYIYLAMSAYFEGAGLSGFAHWMRAQAAEEEEHAMKFFDFVFDRGGRVELQAIDKPPFEWASPLAAFEHALAHEQKVTAMIHDIYTLAGKENDYATQVMLHWFIDEQVEEEKSASAIVDQLKMIDVKGTGLMVLDHKLGSRSDE